jgi:hypothetical protein
MVNSEPLNFAWVTVKLVLPVLVTIIGCEAELPTATDPKLMDGGFSDMVAPPPPGLPGEVVPTQPAWDTITNKTNMIPRAEGVEKGRSETELFGVMVFIVPIVSDSSRA